MMPQRRTEDTPTLLERLSLFRVHYDCKCVTAKKVFVTVSVLEHRKEVILFFQTFQKQDGKEVSKEQFKVSDSELCGLERGATMVKFKEGKLRKSRIQKHSYLSIIVASNSFIFSTTTEQDDKLDTLFTQIKTRLSFVNHWGNLKILPEKSCRVSLHLTSRCLSLITDCPSQCIKQWTLLQHPFPLSVPPDRQRVLRLEIDNEIWQIETSRAAEIMKSINQTITTVVQERTSVHHHNDAKHVKKKQENQMLTCCGTNLSGSKSAGLKHVPNARSSALNNTLKVPGCAQTTQPKTALSKKLSRSSYELNHHKHCSTLKTDNKAVYINQDCYYSNARFRELVAPPIPPRIGCIGRSRSLQGVHLTPAQYRISDYWSKDVTFTLVNVLNNKMAMPDTLHLTWRERCTLSVHMCVTCQRSKGWKDFADQIGMTFEDVQVIEAFCRDHCLRFTCLEVVLQHWQFAHNHERATRPCTREELANVLRRIERPDLLEIIMKPPDLLDSTYKIKRFSRNNADMFY